MRIVTQGKRTYLSNPVSRNRVSKIIPKIYGVSIQVTRLVNGARGDQTSTIRNHSLESVKHHVPIAVESTARIRFFRELIRNMLLNRISNNWKTILLKFNSISKRNSGIHFLIINMPLNRISNKWKTILFKLTSQSRVISNEIQQYFIISFVIHFLKRDMPLNSSIH